MCVQALIERYLRPQKARPESNTKVDENTRPSSFFVSFGFKRMMRLSRSTWDHFNIKSSCLRAPVSYASNASGRWCWADAHIFSKTNRRQQTPSARCSLSVFRSSERSDLSASMIVDRPARTSLPAHRPPDPRACYQSRRHYSNRNRRRLFKGRISRLRKISWRTRRAFLHRHLQDLRECTARRSVSCRIISRQLKPSVITSSSVPRRRTEGSRTRSPQTLPSW